MFVGSVQIISRLDSQSKVQMFTYKLIPAAMVVGSEQSSTNMEAPYWAL